MTEDDNYLERALGRLIDDGLNDARRAVNTVVADAAGRGALGNSRVFLLCDEAVAKAFDTALAKMAALAFDLDGPTAAEKCQLLENAGKRLMDNIVSHLRKQFAGNTSYAVPSVDRLQKSLNVKLERLIDDFSHGVLGGAVVKKDPVAHVIGNIINSPHAVQQIGDNNQQVVHQHATTINQAIDKLLDSDEYRQLRPEEQIALRDTADVLRGEINSATPDVGKVRRWTERLGSLAKQLGMPVAADIFVKVVFAVLSLSITSAR